MKKLFLFLVLSNFLFAQEKTIVLANETSWAPYYGKELKDGGYTTEIIVEAMAHMGYKVKIKWLPWNRAVILAQKGIYDGLGACYYNEKRAQKFVYTDSISDTQTVFFKLKNKDIHYSTLKDLKSYKIGTAKGYGYPKKFTDATYLNKIDAPKIEFNIRKLLKGRIDLVVGSKKVVQHLLNSNYQNDKDKIEIISPVIESMPLYVAFSRNSAGYKQKVEDFNKGLEMIKSDGTFEKILKKHGF